jgi:hypothetical protein
MINKRVTIKTNSFKGDVIIIDKIMTNKADFAKAAIMNNASLEVYVGMFCDLDKMDVECPLIEFLPSNITKIIQ